MEPEIKAPSKAAQLLEHVLANPLPQSDLYSTRYAWECQKSTKKRILSQSAPASALIKKARLTDIVKSLQQLYHKNIDPSRAFFDNHRSLSSQNFRNELKKIVLGLTYQEMIDSIHALSGFNESYKILFWWNIAQIAISNNMLPNNPIALRNALKISSKDMNQNIFKIIVPILNEHFNIFLDKKILTLDAIILLIKRCLHIKGIARDEQFFISYPMLIEKCLKLALRKEDTKALRILKSTIHKVLKRNQKSNTIQMNILYDKIKEIITPSPEKSILHNES